MIIRDFRRGLTHRTGRTIDGGRAWDGQGSKGVTNPSGLLDGALYQVTPTQAHPQLCDELGLLFAQLVEGLFIVIRQAIDNDPGAQEQPQRVFRLDVHLLSRHIKQRLTRLRLILREETVE
ncbi:hypothetical protein D3C77_477850 [compost metagenome]